MEEWEYKIISTTSKPEGEEREMNLLGRDGWELVSVFFTGGITWHYFKRRRRPEGSGGPYRG